MVEEAMTEGRRGVLYPERLPSFHRLPPSPELAHAVRWFWIPEWSLGPGGSSRQELLAFPACNLVVSPDEVMIAGPTTRRSERVLSGSGWAVGALLRPAAVPVLLPEPAEHRDGSRTLAEPGLHREVVRAMDTRRASEADSHSNSRDDSSNSSSNSSNDDHVGDLRRRAAVRAIERWLAARIPVPAPGDEAAVANRLAEALANPAVSRVDQLPALVHVSARTLQRIAARYFGLSLHSMIRRRRLQEGAERLRDDPSLTIAALASALGYADHAHFTTDFRALLGITPSEYRAGGASGGGTGRRLSA